MSAAKNYERRRYLHGVKIRLFTLAIIIGVLFSVAVTSKPEPYEILFFAFEGLLITWLFWYEIKYLFAWFFNWFENQGLIHVEREDGR